MSKKPFALIKNNPFWIVQILGWSFWVLLLLLRDLIFTSPEYLLSLALVYSLSAAVGMVLTVGLRKLYSRVWESGFVIRFLLVWVGSLGIASIWQPFRNYIALLPFGEVIDLSETSFVELQDNLGTSSYPLLLLWSALYFILKYNRMFQAEREKNLKAEALAHEAQLLMLRYQLNPHFLFNTLNAISTLVLAKSTEKANEMLTKLSKFLRYSLDFSPLDKVTLAQELETSRLYLDIEKVRFGDRLRISIDIDEEARRALVPTMILQPIIENSIKHGISKSEDGGSIMISASVTAGMLEISVADDGPGLPSHHSPELLSEDSPQTGLSQLPEGQKGDGLSLPTGVGISNIRERLRQIYADNHTLSFVNATAGQGSSTGSGTGTPARNEKEPGKNAELDKDMQASGLTVTVKIPYDAK